MRGAAGERALGLLGSVDADHRGAEADDPVEETRAIARDALVRLVPARDVQLATAVKGDRHARAAGGDVDADDDLAGVHGGDASR